MKLREELIKVQNDAKQPNAIAISKIREVLLSAGERAPYVRSTNISGELIDNKMEDYLCSEGFGLKKIDDIRDGIYFEVSW